MMQNQKVAFGTAVLLHVLLLIFLIANVDFSHPKRPVLVSDNEPEPVKAIAIDQRKVEAQINAIKTAERRKKQAEDARVKRLQDDALQATKRAAQEKKRLAVLTEKRRKQALEEKQQAEAAKQHLDKMQREQTVEKQRLANLKKQREAQELEQKLRSEEAALLAQQMKAEQEALQAAHQKQQQSELEKYTALVTHAIGRHWIRPDNIADDISCVLFIKLASNGDVLDVSLITSSGDSVLDRSATAAVHKASPLPVPNDPELFAKFREIRLRVKPEGYLM